MDININLLPKELQPKPLIEMRTLIVIVLVLALGFGCYQFYVLKADSEAEAASTQSRIEAMQEDVMALQSNAEAQALTASINEYNSEKALLAVVTQDYLVFAASTVKWGEVLQRVNARVPYGVTITSISQGDGNILEVGGVASGFSSAAAYAAALESEEAFYNVAVVAWDVETGEFLISLNVAPGGDK